MSSPVQFIVIQAHRRRWLVACASAVLVALSCLGILRLSFDADVLSLLPRDGRAIPAFRTFLQRFGSLDQLLVVFTAPEGHAVSEYAGDVDRWVAALKHTPEIAWVDQGTAGSDRDWGWMADHQLLLLHGRALDTALARLQPAGMARELESTRQLLAVPSPAVAQLVREDPLDLFGLLRQQLGGARAGVALGITEGGYVSKDGRRRLVIVKPRRPPYDTDFSHALMQRLGRMRSQEMAIARTAAAGDEPARPGLDVTYAGGYPIAIETEQVVRSESVWNSVGSLALILPLLFIVFRSVWLLVCGAIPSTASLVVVLGLMGLAGVTLSAAATGAAAMLFGLGVDGVVLIYVAHRLALADGLSGEASIAALGSPSESMLLGMFTTAATFYGLVFVDFPSLQQLGLIIGHSMVACGLLTLVLVPAMLPTKPPRRAVKPTVWPWLADWITRHRRLVLVTTAAVTVALAAASLRLHVNASLDRLKSTTPAARYEETVQRMFGLPADVYVFLQQGPSLQPLLEANERVVDRIRAASPALGIEPASALLPSAATQARARAAIAREAPSAEAARAALATQAEAAGYRPDTLAPFRDRLPRLLDSRQQITFDGYRAHGLGDVIGRFVVHTPEGWTLASYAFPAGAAQAASLERIAAGSGAGTLTSLALVDRELAARFVPQFLRGLLIGSLVVVAMIALTFRDWWLSLLSTIPTIVGLVWTAGILAMAGIDLDLFAVFAVVTFVGIGIDYGIHLVHRFQDHGDAALAVAQLAPIIVVAGLITLLGYGTLVTSSYPPLRSIGVVSAISTVALVVASVFVLPALLIAPSRP
ncbi:MAG TPA: MMPL family transporter [Vicinamibacterales bacterium]|nr:MMPL family transporter [Vicinamibacterales bacterium]